MPAKKTTKKVAEKVIEKVVEKVIEKATPAEPIAKLADSYSVFNSFNQFVRKFTLEMHGEKRKEYAEGFAKKIGGKIKEE